MNLKFKKFKEYILKHKMLLKIFVFSIIFSICFCITTRLEFFNYGDRLWNFQIAYKLYNGHELYKGVKIVMTPLYFILENAMFKIFSPNYISVHILNALINSFMYLGVYEIFKNLTKSIKKSLMYTIVVIMATIFILMDGGAYTSLAVAIYIFNVLLKIKNKSNWFIDGITIFLIFISKQNIALLYGVSLIIEFFILKKGNIKNSCIYLLKCFSVLGVLLSCFIGILIYNNCLYNFIDYCFLGLNEFTKNFKVTSYLNLFFCLFIFCSWVLWVYRKKEIGYLDISKIYMLYIYSLCLSLVAYPIFDALHLSLGIIILLILSIIFMDIFITYVKIRKIIKNTLYICSFVMILVTFIYNIMYIYDWNNISVKYEVYKGSYFMCDKKVQNDIEEIVNFVNNQDKKVVIISYKTAIYNNILKENNGFFDIPFLGNMGSEGEEGLIKSIAGLNDSYILIVKDKKNMLWQESMKAREYIIENYMLKGEIGDFLIYETK